MTKAIVTCPGCDTRVSFPTNKGDLRIRCRKCGNMMRWPSKVQETSSSVDRFPLAPSARSHESQSLLVFVMGVAIFSGLVALGGGEGFLLWIILAAFAAVMLNAMVLDPFAQRLRDRAFKNTVCIHGIEGGWTLRICARCMLDHEAIHAERLRLEREAAERREWLEAARTARASALARLRTAWWSRRENLARMNPQAFEGFVAELLREQGHEVEETPYVNDGGWDAVARKSGRTVLVECKRFKPSNTVGRPVLLKLLGAVVSERADEGWVVTTGLFSRPAIEFAEGQPLRLVDGLELATMVEYRTGAKEKVYSTTCIQCGALTKVAVGGPAPRCPSGHTISDPISMTEIEGAHAHGPACPLCGGPMRKRNGRRGAFLGCASYPACKGRRSHSSRKSYR